MHSPCCVCTVDMDKIAAFLIVSNSSTDVLPWKRLKDIVQLAFPSEDAADYHKFTVNFKMNSEKVS